MFGTGIKFQELLGVSDRRRLAAETHSIRLVSISADADIHNEISRTDRKAL